MKHALHTLLFCLLAWSRAVAADYELFPPKEPVECQTSKLHVYSTDELSLRLPPEHRDFVWLDTSVEDQEVKDAKGESRRIRHGVIRFVPLRSGTLEVPPLSATVGKSQVLLRYEPLSVAANPLPSNATRIATFWNGNVDPPAYAVAGESFNLEILLFGARDPKSEPKIADPQLLLPGARWQVQSANMFGKDISYFFKFYGRNYSETTTRQDDIDFTVRRYKTRFTVGENGTLEGVLAADCGIGRLSRTVFQRVSIPIRPLPPAPQGEFINTGLIGQWSFQATLDPAQPVAGQPFTLKLEIDGNGERYQCAKFDFAAPGFKSLGISLNDTDTSRFDHWRGRFEQRLLATGQVRSFPALILGSFDPKQGKWVKHSLLAEQAISGAAAQAAAADLTTTPDAGKRVRRPVWLNTPAIVLPLVALAPLLPVLAGFLRRRLDRRDPQLAALRRQRSLLVRQLERTNPAELPSLLDEHGLPLLRAHLGLPAVAAPGEIAAALEQNDRELAEALREHDQRRFSGGAAALDGRKLSRLFARIALLFALTGLAPLQAVTPEECDAAARNSEWEKAAKGYGELIGQDPERPAFHLNLAKVFTRAGRLQEARAACHTALLLDPSDSGARDLHASLLRQLNEPPIFSMGLWRPDQLIVLVAILWVAGCGALALRRLRWLSARWPAFTLFALAVCVSGAVAWRSSAYAPGQYLVISKDDPTLPLGSIVRGTAESDGITISNPDGSPRRIPAKLLRAIW